jgi:O-antigen/teichoic acid export membrane protein
MHLLQTIRNNSFLKHNAILFVGGVLVGAANYLYYPIMGRLLKPADFGEVQALISLFLQLALLLTVLGQVTVNIVANYTDEQKRQLVVFELEKFAFIMSLGLCLILAALSWKLREFFQFEAVAPFLVLLLASVASVPVSFRSAFLRANQRFTEASITQLIVALSKIVFSFGLVVLGFRATGAIGGLVIAQLVAFWYAAAMARKFGFTRPGSYFSWPNIRVLAPELKYALFVLASTGIVTLLTSIDVLVAKHYFDPHTAGEYAGISTVAKIIFFLTASVAQVLMPSIKLHQPNVKNRALFLRSLALIWALGLPVLGVFYILPELVVRLLIGTEYTRFAEILPQLGIAMMLLATVNLQVSYNVALRRYQSLYAVFAGAVLITILMVTRHDSLVAIVGNLSISSVVMLSLLAIPELLHRTK